MTTTNRGTCASQDLVPSLDQWADRVPDRNEAMRASRELVHVWLLASGPIIDKMAPPPMLHVGRATHDAAPHGSCY